MLKTLKKALKETEIILHLMKKQTLLYCIKDRMHIL